MTSDDAAAWAAVDRWIDDAPILSDLEEHRLELLAARRLRALGRAVPEPMRAAERKAAVMSMTAPMVLDRVREAAEGPLILFKGLEIAALYPDPSLRTLHDLDLLVPDAAAVQRRLIAAGFVEVGVPELYEDIHHLRPLQWPGLPVLVEVHRCPKWLEGVAPPPIDVLLAAAGPAAAAVPGVLTLAPSHHALVVAAHSWTNSPLGRLRDLLDAHLLALQAAPGEIEAAARRWGMERVWRTTARATAALIDPGRPASAPLRTWARHLRTARGRTVLEYHVQRWSSGFWAMAPRPATAVGLRALLDDLRPDDGESWRAKARRSGRSMWAASRRKVHHDVDELDGDELHRPDGR
jgi:Uncharacterised nucleotidyltransferase